MREHWYPVGEGTVQNKHGKERIPRYMNADSRCALQDSVPISHLKVMISLNSGHPQEPSLDILGRTQAPRASFGPTCNQQHSSLEVRPRCADSSETSVPTHKRWSTFSRFRNGDEKKEIDEHSPFRMHNAIPVIYKPCGVIVLLTVDMFALHVFLGRTTDVIHGDVH